MASWILHYPLDNTPQLQKKNHNKTRRRNVQKLTNWRLITNVHLSYDILLQEYKNITITLQKEQEYPLKFSFCFQTGDEIAIYVYIYEHWKCTTRQKSCT